MRGAYRATARKVSAEGVRDTWNATALLEQFPGTQVPNTFRVLAERNVAHTRELYEGSKNTLQAVLESWQKSFGAAGQGAATLNRRFIDLAERNINTGFDLAMGLAGARNLTRSWNCRQPIGASYSVIRRRNDAHSQPRALEGEISKAAATCGPEVLDTLSKQTGYRETSVTRLCR